MFTAANVYYCKQTNLKSKKNTWHWTVTNNINILTRWLYVLRLIAVTLLHHEFSTQVKIQLLLLFESKISNGVIHQSASHNQHLTLHDYGEWMHQQWNAFVASHDRNCARYIWSNERDPCSHEAMNHVRRYMFYLKCQYTVLIIVAASLFFLYFSIRLTVNWRYESA